MKHKKRNRDLGRWQKLRFEILLRDNFSCRYCGQSAPDVVLHVDHKKPISEGGDDSTDNLVTACSACNFGKEQLRKSLLTEYGSERAFKYLLWEPSPPPHAFWEKAKKYECYECAWDDLGGRPKNPYEPTDDLAEIGAHWEVIESKIPPKWCLQGRHREKPAMRLAADPRLAG